jgi:hypothetical protein
MRSQLLKVGSGVSGRMPGMVLLAAALTAVPLTAQQRPPLPGLEFLDEEDLAAVARRSQKNQIKQATKPVPAKAAPAGKAAVTAKGGLAGEVPALGKPGPAEPATPAAGSSEKVLLAWMNLPRIPPAIGRVDPGEQLHQASKALPAAPPPAQAPEVTRPSRSGPQFRDLRWGFTRAEVEAAEKSLGKARVIESGTSTTIAFNDLQVASRKAMMLCTFVFNRLARGVYVFKDELPDDQDWFGETSQLVEILSEKYGRPQRQENWLEDLYRNDPRYWGLALRRGHVQFENTWDLPETVIRLKLVGTRYGISLSLAYESKFYIQVLTEVERKKRHAGL